MTRPVTDDPRAERVRALFDKTVEPKLKWSINALNLLQEVRIDGDGIAVTLNLVTQETHEIDGFREELTAGLRHLGFAAVDLVIGHVNIATQGIDGVKQIVLVGSGKGGVGKSLVAVNLACGLARSGLRVGIMDADIHGPSLPVLLGIAGQKPEVLADDVLRPIEAHGVKAMSVGMLVPQGQAVEWRGPMAAGTLIQFIHKTLWGDLDVLVIDLPPGTGDLHLTLADKIRAAGAIVVTTPQEVVLGDVRRSLDQWHRHGIPILGVVENMSHLICEHCGGINRPFAAPKHREGVAETCGLARLTALPLDKRLAQGGDAGRPAILEDYGDGLGDALRDFIEAARVSLATRLSADENPPQPSLIN